MNRHKITNKERGHRAPLSAKEKTKQYSIKVVSSLKRKLVSLGATAVRKILTDSTSCAKEIGLKKDE